MDGEDRDLARHVLDLRRALERARSEEEIAKALKELGKLLPPDLVEMD